MKPGVTDNKLVIILICLVLSCSGSKRYDNSASSGENKPVGKDVKQEKQFYIRDNSNNTLGSIDVNFPIVIKWKETSLYRVVKDEKSKYRNENNQNLYEIKYSEDGFKLRDANGQLLWKLKYKDTKLKIASNEEMTGAFEVKQDGQEVEIKRDEKRFKSIDLGTVSVPMLIKSGKGSLMISGPAKNSSFAILAIEDIPVEQQLILITEVLLSGK